MPRSALPLRLLFTACLLACGIQAGCAQHRIPAIDPTGEHIFSGTTTLASHDLLNGGLFHKHHQPAAVVPAGVAIDPQVKPLCAPPIEVVPVVPVIPVPVVAVPQNPVPIAITAPPPACEQPVVRGPELTITPNRIVAPVNTEVIMAAGICSPDGYYVTRQPLEWMLAQDGVGQIVAVGHESPHNASLLLRSSPQKIATNYARAHTSTISQCLDRGTPTPTDDVYLHKGQSWISITSPTEGASHVVVWTPKEHNWDHRKATATIYWVDATWKFPPSVTARAGQGQLLTTVVTRSNGDPVRGWIVRYDVIDGPPATFGRGVTFVEAPTDVAGRATAELLPASLEQGITTVRVQIIRPGSARGEAPQMVVGQGIANVQWTTPGLAVRAMGSPVAMADGAIGYRVEVTNNGDQVTHNVALSYSPPTGVNVLNSTPPAQPFGQRLEWRLGNLPPGTTSVVEVNCRAMVPGSIRSEFVATSTEVPRVVGRPAPTEVRANALAVRMTGPETVEVGREARFVIEVTNNGALPLVNVTAADTFEPGLAHAAGERSPVVRPIAIIQPGQTEQFAISFNVLQPGRHCHRLDVTAEGGHAAGARACVTGTAAVVTPPQLSVRVNGPPTSAAGENALYTVEVKNNGSAPATNVVLDVSWGLTQQLLEATGGREEEIQRRLVHWRVAQIAGGEALSRKLNFRCESPDGQGALVRATVSADRTSPVTNQMTTVIAPGAARAPMRPDVGRAAAPIPGSLRITASATANPILAGGRTAYVINITNDRAVSDQNVALSVQALDDGITIQLAGSTPTGVAAGSPTAIDFQPIRELRGGETQSYRIEVRGLRPGPHKLRVSATSFLNPTVTATETDLAVTAQ